MTKWERATQSYWCTEHVSVMPLWLNSGCICQWCFLRSCGLKLWCPPGVSAWTYSLCPLHPSYFWNCVLSLSFTSWFLWWQPAVQIWQHYSTSWNYSFNSVLYLWRKSMDDNQLQLNNDKTEMILIATETVLNSDCSTVHKSGGFWHQICQHSSQPRCLSWSYSLFPTADLLRLSYLLSWTSLD